MISGGSKKTADFARKHGKPLLHLHPGIETPGRELASFIRTNGIKVLNVAGPCARGRWTALRVTRFPHPGGRERTPYAHLKFALRYEGFGV